MVYFVIGLLLILADLGVKGWVSAHLALGASQTLVPGILDLLHIQNTGAAFSILQGAQWFFYVTTIIALGVVVFLWKESRGHLVYRLGLTMITAGAIGNFIDRVRFGYVTDMFHLPFMDHTPFNAIFNVADICISVGVLLVVIYLLFLDRRRSA